MGTLNFANINDPERVPVSPYISASVMKLHPGRERAKVLGSQVACQKPSCKRLPCIVVSVEASDLGGGALVFPSIAL